MDREEFERRSEYLKNEPRAARERTARLEQGVRGRQDDSRHKAQNKERKKD